MVEPITITVTGVTAAAAGGVAVHFLKDFIRNRNGKSNPVCLLHDGMEKSIAILLEKADKTSRAVARIEGALGTMDDTRK